MDRLIAARDRRWFRTYAKQRTIPIHRYLNTLACSHLVRRAGITETEESTELSALTPPLIMHWLTITMPEDTLLAALGVEPAPVRLDIDPPLLVKRLLDDGVAEIHQHIGAGMSFPLLWVSALAAIASPAVNGEELLSPGAPFDNGKFLLRWLLAAAIARCALAEHLLMGDNNFKLFLSEQFLDGKKSTCQHPKEEDNPCCCSVCLKLDRLNPRITPRLDSLSKGYINPST